MTGGGAGEDEDGTAGVAPSHSASALVRKRRGLKFALATVHATGSTSSELVAPVNAWWQCGNQAATPTREEP